jgi:nitrite reductase/ring-hydroxylating ferredoxin subunit
MRLDEVDPELSVGTIVSVEPGLAALHTRDGWVAVADACPHAGCAFSADGELADDGTLICNCHGSEFDPSTGAVRLGPATAGLTVHRLRVERNTLNFDRR